MIRTQKQNDSLLVTGLAELSSRNCVHFKELVKVQLGEQLRVVDVDCSELKFLDSEGMGALISVRRFLAPRAGVIRLNKVTPSIRRLLELVKFQEIVEIHD